MLYFAFGTIVNLNHLNDAWTHMAYRWTPNRVNGLHSCTYRLPNCHLAELHGAAACNIEPAQGEVLKGAIFRSHQPQ
ncbi:MAG: hypothetical protein IH899_12260 [Planctomycetes bacterium]|nr:hypothetical protein [Planctomycetota bacterium]